jgi:5'-phosphate synthase pdxT subunit
MKIGVLSAQGAFVEHAAALRAIDVEPIEVRLPRHLDGIDGLILPGGESTTIGKLLRRWELIEPIRDLARSGLPVWGTCAGMILLARDLVDAAADQPLLGLMDVTVRRNAFGRQVDSFEADLDVACFGKPAFRAVFIRAPRIERAGDGVEVLATLADGTIVAAQQGALLVTSFHPELTEDRRFHRHFASLCSDERASIRQEVRSG